MFRRIRCLGLSTVFIIICTISNAFAVEIIAVRLPYLLDDTFGGRYNKLVDELRAGGLAFSLTYYPAGRATVEFGKQQYDCMLPIDSDYFQEKHPIITSIPFNYAKAYIFTSHQNPVISSIDELTGKRLAVRRGFVYGDALNNENVTYVPVSNIENSLGMLSKNRVDAFLAYGPDAFAMAKTRGMLKLQYDKSSPVHVQQEAVICHDSLENRDFIDELNGKLKSLKESGKLKGILAEIYDFSG